MDLQRGAQSWRATLRFLLVFSVTAAGTTPVLWHLVPRDHLATSWVTDLAGGGGATTSSAAPVSEDRGPVPSAAGDSPRIELAPETEPDVVDDDATDALEPDEPISGVVPEWAGGSPPDDRDATDERPQIAVPRGAPGFEPGQTSERAVSEAPDPAIVSIPAIGVESSLVRLGLNDDQTMQVPDFPVAGWYTGSARPGQRGPAVLAGHVDSYDGPAVFYRLSELEPGDEIDIIRDDESVVSYVVDRLEQFDKDEFPTEQVYDPTTEPELRLITCGGDFDTEERSYRDNIIVFASPES